MGIRQFSADGKIGYAIVDGRICRIDPQTGGVTPLHDDQFLNIQYTILGVSPTGTVAATSTTTAHPDPQARDRQATLDRAAARRTRPEPRATAATLGCPCASR